MAEPLKRRPFQGVWTVIRFNWHFHAFALALVAVLLAAGFLLTGAVRTLLLVSAAAALLPLITSLAATWIAYDASGLYQLNWLERPMQGTATAANIHAGFDETTALLKFRFPHINWRVFDFYDPAKHTEVSIRRARATHPPYPGTLQITTGRVPLADASLDRVLLILAAHEIRDHDERVAFFRELKRMLAPGGQVIVTEHLRDLPNIAAYTLGAWHFHPRSEWLATFEAAGFQILGESKTNPFITTFILGKHGNPS